ncbi:MAG: DNA primase [Gammaproteobacteria bacterium]|nr:DNA primase [Gammaproteobacteria bacterium]
MSGRIPKHFIDDLLARVDIVELIDTYVPLKKAGVNYIARCPFHSEKTPSFSVNRGKQFFHCFGCGASGNAIGFLMDFNHLDFVEAVEDLATFAGVDVIRDAAETQLNAVSRDTVNDQYQLLEHVAAFYVHSLRTAEAGKKAVAYLKARSINDELAQRFMLGYASNEWQALANRFDRQILIQTGMLIEKDGKVYDRFRDRIMFPIRDKRGRITGFGGRVLDDSLPKYLNSPETAIFHKSKEVYGLYELLRKQGKPKRILIVEGYIDVIILAGYGIDYAVATLGTATSQAHLELLFRFAPELVFCFDGDNAGREAAWKAMEPAFGTVKDGRQIRIMLLPKEHDPDSLVRTEGADKFTERVGRSQALSDYFFSTLTHDLNINELEGRSQLINKAKPYLDKLSPGVFKEMMFAQLNQLTRAGVLDVSADSATLRQQPQRRSERKDGIVPLPRRIAALLVQYPELIATVEHKEILWEEMEFPGVDLFKLIFTDIKEKKPANTAVLMELYRGQPQAKAVNYLAALNLFVDGQELDLTAVASEFKDAFEKLMDQAKKKAEFRALMAKAGKG